MTHFESEPVPEVTWSQVVDEERQRLGVEKLSAKELSFRLGERALNGTTNRMTHHAVYELEASERLARFDRLTTLLGWLAPAGTAPRTAIEQIYIQSETNAEESQIVLDLRAMLANHWGDWTPALREAEGLPPSETPVGDPPF